MVASLLSVQKNNVVENIALKTNNDGAKANQNKIDTSNPSVAVEISDTAKALNFLSMLVENRWDDVKNNFIDIETIPPGHREKIDSLLEEFELIIAPEREKPIFGGEFTQVYKSPYKPMDIPEKRALVEEIKRKIDELLLSIPTSS